MMNLIDKETIASLKQLEESTGQELISELLDIFCSAVPETLREMKKALDAREYESLAKMAHSLKSSAGNVGAQFVSEKAQVLEKGLRYGELDHQQAGELLSEIVNNYEDSVSQLRAA